MADNDFKYEIVQKIATLTDNGKGYTKEINLIKYNDSDPLYDIRKWHNGEMQKGVTLTKEELIKLMDACKDIK